MNKYLINNHGSNVVLIESDTTPLVPFLEVQDGMSTLEIRYGCVDGCVIDLFTGMTDDQVHAAVIQENTASSALEQQVTKVSPVEFKLLFTPQERIAIKAVRSTDPIIDDFYDIAEDPRLTHVDLSLQTTKMAIGYMVSLDLITQERADNILSGKPV